VSAEAQNLAAISAAIDWHTHTCGEPLIRILMSPHEVERLGWDEIRGIPIVADPELGTGRFRLVCSGIHGGDGEATEAEGVEVEEVVEQTEPLYV
jgi:hypothetical protein